MDFLYKGVRGCAMTTPFDTAWALLKNEPYPLTPEEEHFRQQKKEAYSLARRAKPQPLHLSDEAYEDIIELMAEDELARRMAQSKSDYPWPKKHPFQTTFENDGSINRDPMVTQQRKLNARMARESNRREAVPSRIEISPRDNNRGGRDFSLLNNEGEVLSQISGYGNDKYNPTINDFYGGTIEPYRRQGMYRKLMQALIGAGIPVKSHERNHQSNPFHQKLLESLPPNIESSYVDAYGNPKTGNSVEDLSYNQPLTYYQNRVPQFDNARGRSSGLNTKDYGAIPIVNQENQAKNVDELAEQDSLKIRRGQGHIPETVGIQATQPMARNTYQIRFNPNFENEYPPLYSGSYDNRGGYSSVEELGGFRDGNPV